MSLNPLDLILSLSTLNLTFRSQNSIFYVGIFNDTLIIHVALGWENIH